MISKFQRWLNAYEFCVKNRGLRIREESDVSIGHFVDESERELSV